jgi:hypothetical protein
MQKVIGPAPEPDHQGEDRPLPLFPPGDSVLEGAWSLALHRLNKHSPVLSLKYMQLLPSN